MLNITPNKTLIFAHRGFTLEAAENTRTAFDKALHYPIDGIETDVQLTRDDVAVLWHDRQMEKLGHPGKRIGDFDFAELEAINFAAQCTPEIQAEGVLSLKEFLMTYRGRCRLQIEIKNRDWEPVARHQIKIKQILDLLGSATNMDVFISSFNLQSMVFADQFNTNIPLFYALDKTQHLTSVEQALADHHFLAGLCLPIQILDETMMQVFRNLDKKVLTYTCNSDAHIHKALDLGVAVLITDDPQKALTMRESCNVNFPV
ncbi:MAG: glycerophosphodiester phosphodiesterase [Methylococcales bacterium]